MPDYLDEPSEEEIKLTESMRQADTEPPPEKAEEPAEPKAEEAEESPPEEVAAEKPGEEDKAAPEEPKVNLGALHEARARNRELRDRMVAMEARFSDVMKKLEETPAPKAPEEPIPSYDEDPAGHLKHQIETLTGKLSELEITGKQSREQDAEVQEQQRFMSRYRASAEEYGIQQTDFMAAYEWLSKDADAELKVRGYSDPLDRQRIMAQEEFALVGNAFKDDANPAERLYELAKRRGYKAEAPKDENKIVNLEKAKGAAKTLSGTGGGTDNAITLQHLTDLEGKEFDAQWEKLRKAGKLG